MAKITIDFETRSRADIQECGAWAYSVHPSTEVLCLAYAIDDGPVQLVNWKELLLCPFGIEGSTFVAHNAFFEECIWTNVMVKKWGWPRIPLNQFRCSAAKARASAYPGKLEKACLALKTVHQKSLSGRTIMLKLSKPNKEGDWNEDPKDFEKLYQYCVEDVLAERDLDKALPDLIPAEQTIWFLDQRINARGIAVDKEAVEKALGFIDVYTRRLNDTVFERSGGVLSGVTRRQAVLDWCKSLGVNVPGYTKTDVHRVLRADDLPASVRLVLDTKLQLGKTSVAKYTALQAATTEDGRIRDTLIYHGATTGRWTGKLIQLQNLPKGDVKDIAGAIDLLKKTDLEAFEMIYPDVMGTLSSCIRGMFISAPGTELFVGDFSAIEARVVMWQAGETRGLDQWASGEDLYKSIAATIYGAPVEKVTKAMRQLGKTVILGSGFGMGPKKFLLTCEAQGVAISPELAEKAVNTYREAYSAVKNSWYAQENAAVEATRSGAPVVCGKVTWDMAGGNLRCKLPSGRFLTYPGAYLEYADTSWGDRKLTLHFWAENPKTRQWEVERTYGGRLVENITQAIARDLLATALLRCEKAGYPPVMHVHDEVVAEVPVVRGDLDEYKKLLEVTPDWAQGLPIKAECWRGTRYKKG